MSERVTSVGPRDVGDSPSSERRKRVFGIRIADHGRRSRSEMIERFRSYFEYQRQQAEFALSLADEELIVETYLGSWAMRNCEEVTE